MSLNPDHAPARVLARTRWNVRRILAGTTGAVARRDLLARLSTPQRAHLDDVLCEYDAAGLVAIHSHGDGTRYLWTGPVDPTEPAPTGLGFGGDSRTYPAVHQRLRAKRGPAAALECDECGDPAASWAYDHADPAEVYGPTKAGRTGRRPYSLDLAHYRPLCTPCHNAEDAGRPSRDHCKAGHLLTPDNVYARSNGGRDCSTCRRAWREARHAAA